MRIAFFADNFYPELSGITDSILTTAKELVARGHDIIFVGPRYTPKDYALIKKHQTEHISKNGIVTETVEDITTIRLPSTSLPNSPTGQSRIALPSGKAVAFLKVWKPDIIHTHSPYGCGFEAKKAAKVLGVPLIGTNHTPIEEYYPFAPETMRYFDAWYYNQCDFVSTPFAKLLSRMREVGLTKPGRAVSNPVLQSVFRPVNHEEKRLIKQKLALVGPVIIYAGRLAAEKHIDIVILSLPLLVTTFPDLVFVVAGHGSSEETLKKQVTLLKLQKHVRFTGFLPPSILKEYYAAADVFTLMSTVESQPISLLQAYSCGIPAIGASARGLPDHIPASCGFLVTPGDYTSLAQKIEVLFQNDILRSNMSAATLEYIQKFSAEKIAHVWEDIYQEHILSKNNS